MAALIARPIRDRDRTFAQEQIVAHFGSNRVVSRGRLHDCATLPGLIAWHGTRPVGIAHYHRHESDLEVVTLVSVEPGIGTGRLLLEALADRARRAGLPRCWLITTNNNLNALGFYRRVGWQLAATHTGAVDEARRIKPEIPLVDDRGVPIRDELEFELRL